MLVKTEEYNYARDTDSMALINMDRSAKEEYLTKRKLLTTQRMEISRINNEIHELKNDISEIKSMLLQILSDKN